MQGTAANTYVVLAFTPMDVMPSPWLCVTVFKSPEVRDGDAAVRNQDNIGEGKITDRNVTVWLLHEG